ncbi:MAG: hypothetical protein ABFS28_17045 [Bacteroidota bacterium]
MRRNMILGIFLLAAISLYGQESTNHIELLGKGIAGKDRASIVIPEWEDVDWIVAEAVYACGKAPGDVKISSDKEDRIIEPGLIPCGGNNKEGMITSVFRTKFTSPTPKVVLDIMHNSARFQSFSLYVHRPDSKITYIPAEGMPHLQGELNYISNNVKIPELTAFDIPVTSEARDVQVKFGLTEFKDDDLVAVFTFESKGETVATEIRTWFRNGKVDSYAVQELMFENVAGEVDKVHLTMFSAHSNAESFIAGRVFLDMQVNKIALLSASGN